MDNQKLTKIALLCAVAIVLGYIESLLPPLFLPGIKLGISNIVLLFALYRLGIGTSFFIMLIKVAVSSLLFSGMNVFFYSLSGGICSILIMGLFRNRYFSVSGVSVLGGVFHNLGQLMVAAIVLGKNALYYFPILLISGAVMGFVTGLCADTLLKYIKS